MDNSFTFVEIFDNYYLLIFSFRKQNQIISKYERRGRKKQTVAAMEYFLIKISSRCPDRSDLTVGTCLYVQCF